MIIEMGYIMTIYHNKTLYTLLAIFLVFCICISFMSVPVHAEIVTGTAVALVGASVVIASVLTALGVSKGVSSDDFNSLVDNLGVYLQGLGYVTTDGKMKVSVLQSGVAMIGSSVIKSISNYIFGHNPDGTRYITSGVDYPNMLRSYPDFWWCYETFKDKESNGIFPYRWLGYTFYDTVLFGTSGGYDSCILMYNCKLVKNTSYSSGSTIVWDIVKNDSTGEWHEFHRIGNSFSNSIPSRIDNVHYTTIYSNLPIVPSTTYDISITGVGGYNPDYDNLDVIYPGWATNSETIDNNIESELTYGGAIDNVIEADKYYPINVPKTYTGALDLSQSQAQEGTLSSALEDTQEPSGGNGSNIDLLPVITNGFNFPNIWHYVTEWIGVISSYVSTCLTVWSYLPYGLVVPVYASIVLIIVFGLYRKFIK